LYSFGQSLNNLIYKKNENCIYLCFWWREYIQTICLSHNTVQAAYKDGRSYSNGTYSDEFRDPLFLEDTVDTVTRQHDEAASHAPYQLSIQTSICPANGKAETNEARNKDVGTIEL